MKKLRNILLSALAISSISCASIPKVEPNYQENVKKGEIDSYSSLTLDFEKGQKQNKIDYQLFEAEFVDGLFSANLKISPNQSFELQNILKGVKDRTINSYSNLIDFSKSLSEIQKLALLSAITSSAYNYDYHPYKGEVISQESFFKKLQGAFNEEEDIIGVCRHIGTNIEKFANDLGLRASAVTGNNPEVGHLYTLIKREKGTSIIDDSQFFSSDTKNIEKILETYQKEKKSISFQHLFFEDSKFKYDLISKDGKNFLNFVNYDPSLNPIKNSLLNKINRVSYLTLNINKKDNLFSSELEFMGSYFKGGILTENLSPENKINLFQGGFKRKFFIPKIMSIHPDVSLVYGKQERVSSNDFLSAFIGSLIISTENKEGLNFSSRFSKARSDKQEGILFYKIALDGGISYTLPINNFKIQPYFLSQFSVLTKDVGTAKEELKLNELETGLKFSFMINKTNFLLDSFYTKRLWEQEIGVNTGLNIKNLNLNFGGYFTKPNYYFCPNKSGLILGLTVPLGAFNLNLNYKRDRINYYGEIEDNSLFSIRGTLNL